MKTLFSILANFCVALVLFLLGGFLRHPHPCADCFQAYGFPFTYGHDGLFTGGGDFYLGWMIADILALLLLTALMVRGWDRITVKRRQGQTG